MGATNVDPEPVNGTLPSATAPHNRAIRIASTIIVGKRRIAIQLG
jgi:hypothetical protein